MTLPHDRMTKRRLDVLRLAANGFTNQEIADDLLIGVNSVMTHMQMAMRSLGAKDRAHAVAICIVRGLIQPHEVPLPAPRPPLRKNR